MPSRFVHTPMDSIRGAESRPEESPGHQISCHLTLDTIEEASVMPQEILHGYDRLIDDDAKTEGLG